MSENKGTSFDPFFGFKDDDADSVFDPFAFATPVQEKQKEETQDIPPETPAEPENKEEPVVEPKREAEENKTPEAEPETSVAEDKPEVGPSEDMDLEKIEPVTPTEPAAKEEPAIEPEPEKKKTRRGRKKTSEKTDEANEEKSEDEVTQVKYDPNKININMIRDKFIPQVNDPGWDKVVQDVEDRIGRIKFDEKINAGSILIQLPIIDDIYCDIYRYKAEHEAAYKTIAGQLIPRMKVANSLGSNPEERKKRSVASCEDFKLNGVSTTINLYDLEILLNYRCMWLQAKMDYLDKKRDLMTKALAVLKMQQQ